MNAAVINYTEQHKTWEGEQLKDNGETISLRFIETLDFVTFSNTKPGFGWGFEGEWSKNNDDVYVKLDTLRKGMGSYSGTYVACANFGATCDPTKTVKATFELDAKGNVVMKSPGLPEWKFSYLHIAPFEGAFGFYSDPSCVTLNQWLNYNGRVRRMRVTVNEAAGFGKKYDFELFRD